MLIRRTFFFIWLLKLLSLFQYISFTTIGKDPKDPSLVSNVKGELGKKMTTYTQNEEK